MHEVLGGDGEKKNGPNSSGAPRGTCEPVAAERSQMEAGRKSECSTPWGLGKHTSGWGPPLVSGHNLIGFPPGNVYSCHHLTKTHLALLSHHYLLRNSLRRHPQACGLKGHRVGRRRQWEEYALAAALFSSLVVPDSMKWCENLARTPPCSVIATQKSSIQFPFFSL